MTTTMTAPTTDRYLSIADKCRAALKAAGFKANQVSVKCHHSTVYVTIRTAAVSILAVEEVVNQFVVVYRDHGPSQEILIGGTSIYVRYAPEVLASLKAEILAAITATPARIGVQIGPHDVFWAPHFGVTQTPDHNSMIGSTTHLVVGSQMTLNALGASFGAEQLAVDLLARGIKTLAA